MEKDAVLCIRAKVPLQLRLQSESANSINVAGVPAFPYHCHPTTTEGRSAKSGFSTVTCH